MKKLRPSSKTFNNIAFLQTCLFALIKKRKHCSSTLTLFAMQFFVTKENEGEKELESIGIRFINRIMQKKKKKINVFIQTMFSTQRIRANINTRAIHCLNQQGSQGNNKDQLKQIMQLARHWNREQFHVFIYGVSKKWKWKMIVKLQQYYTKPWSGYREKQNKSRPCFTTLCTWNTVAYIQDNLFPHFC